MRALRRAVKNSKNEEEKLKTKTDMAACHSGNGVGGINEVTLYVNT